MASFFNFLFSRTFKGSNYAFWTAYFVYCFLALNLLYNYSSFKNMQGDKTLILCMSFIISALLCILVLNLITGFSNSKTVTIIEFSLILLCLPLALICMQTQNTLMNNFFAVANHTINQTTANQYLQAFNNGK
jgi:hypothetical protein